MNSIRRRACRRQTRGAEGRAFTLAEVVLSVMILGIISVALASSIRLAAKAAPSTADTLLAAQRADRCADRIRADIVAATSASAPSATALVLQVPDRTGDGVPETIQYAWSGVPGAPLVCTENGVVYNAADAVDAFSAVLGTAAQTVISGTAVTVGAESVIASYRTIGSSETDLTKTQSVAQVFTPRLPSDAIAWALTKVLIYCRQGSGSANITVQLTNVASDLPGSTVYSTTTLASATLPSSRGWATITPTGVPSFAPGQQVAIVLSTAALSAPMRVTTAASGVADRYGSTAITNLLGVWTAQPEGALAYEVYGTVTRKLNATATATRAASIRVSMKATGAADAQEFSATLWGLP